ncbi:restriction endonuclease subunit S, partial [Escherichia coli]|nr:restriction endonuclease subunit S [Escherichia coli]
RLNGTELLITLVGNPGDCVVVEPYMAGWNAARALAVVRLKDTGLREWLKYILLSKPAKHLIDARLNTTVQKTLNLKDIRELGIPIPPK